MPGQRRQAFLEGLFLQHMLMMHKIVVSSHHLGRFPVGVVFVFSHRPTFWHRLLSAFGRFVRNGSDQTGIQSTREDNADRNVSHQALLHTVDKGLKQGRSVESWIPRNRRSERLPFNVRRIEKRGLPRSVQRPPFNRSRSNLVNALEQRGAVKRVLPNQPRSHGHFVKFRSMGVVSPERLHFAGEHQGGLHHGSNQRFDAHGVSSEDEFPSLRIPKRNGVHTVERGQPGCVFGCRQRSPTVLCALMDGQHRFGVPQSGERIGAVATAKLTMVVDFTVHDHHGSFGALHRLLARLEVDD